MTTGSSRHRKNKKVDVQAHFNAALQGAILTVLCLLTIYGLEVERLMEYSDYQYAGQVDEGHLGHPVTPLDPLLAENDSEVLPSFLSSDAPPTILPEASPSATPVPSPSAKPKSTPKPSPSSRKVAVPSPKPVTSTPTPAASNGAEVPPVQVTAPILDFGPDLVIHGAGSMEESNSSLWWVNSGGDFTVQGGGASTIQGAAAIGSPDQVRYGQSHPETTDHGLYPQNLFRLISKANWSNVRQTGYFQVKADHLLDVSTRNGSNGLLFFSRYVDQYNLYYAGIRVDGYTVIKKKIAGNYYTMATKKVIEGPSYNLDTNPTLLPKDQWMGLRLDTQTNADGSVTLTLYTDLKREGSWTKSLQVTDDGKSFGGTPFTQEASVGIRTDFMDVVFDQYRAESL